MNTKAVRIVLSALKLMFGVIALITGLVPPIAFIYLNGRDVWRGWPKIFILSGILTVLIQFLEILVKHCNEEPGNFGKFLRTVWSRINESFPAFIIGTCIGAIGSGIHLFYSEGGPAHERYDTVIGIYLSAITASLGIRAFYDRLIPITSVNTLVRRVTADLKRCREGGLLIVYPALNLGYFRNALAGSTRLVDELSKALQECAEELKDAHAVTYSQAHIDMLYQTYAEAHGKAELATQCAKNAKQMSSDLVRAVGRSQGPDADNYVTQHYFDHIHSVNPDAFPQHVIVIGSITYVMVSYGLPIYRPPKNGVQESFEMLTGEHKLVEIVAYRREDSALAHMITSHLRQLLSLKQPKTGSAAAPTTAGVLQQQ